MPDKKYRLHFFLDENFPLSAGEFLKSLGYAVTFFPSGLANLKYADENVLRYAKKHRCILLTKDTDFLTNQALVELVSVSYGIVFFVTANPDLKNWQSLIRKMLKIITPKQIFGKILRVTMAGIEYLTPNKD